MERLLIILAVLVCVAAGTAVVAMSGRGRRPPLRMDRELDAGDEHLLIGSLGTPESPIDRSAQVLDAQVLDTEPVAPPEIESPEIASPETAPPKIAPPKAATAERGGGPIDPPGRGLPDAAR